MKTIFIAIAIFIAIMTMPTVVKAASISDSNNTSTSTSDNKGVLPASGSTESQPGNSNSKTLVLTAVPDKPTISAGDTETIHIKATTGNGTAISDATIQALVIDYVTAKQKVLLGGQTNDKGLLDISAAIGPHAKSGQFLVGINGTKDGIVQGISTGFAVTGKDTGSSSGGGSSSSSGSSSMKTDSKGRCSGSSCK